LVQVVDDVALLRWVFAEMLHGSEHAVIGAASCS
jgi:hypothetical protein